MLLFVIQAENDHGMCLLDRVLTRTLDKRFYRPIDVFAIVPYFRERGPRHQSPHVARRTIADGIIVRIKEIRKLWMEFAIGAIVRHENEGLEKPGGMRKLPFYGRAFHCRLNNAVFDGQRLSLIHISE